jgi:hypothetical protein
MEQGRNPGQKSHAILHLYIKITGISMMPERLYQMYIYQLGDLSFSQDKKFCYES